MSGCAGGKVREGVVQMVSCTYMQVYARTRELVFVGIKYFGRGARTMRIAREVGVADAGTNGNGSNGVL